MEEETETWDGPKLAHDADPDDIDFDKINVDIDADDEDDDDDDEDDSEEFDVQFSPSDERLWEELLRLKLTSLPSSASPDSSLLPLSGLGNDVRGPIQRLLEPRSKLEQFEDIIFESQLLEAGFPELEGKFFFQKENRNFSLMKLLFQPQQPLLLPMVLLKAWALTLMRQMPFSMRSPKLKAMRKKTIVIAVLVRNVCGIKKSFKDSKKPGLMFVLVCH